MTNLKISQDNKDVIFTAKIIPGSSKTSLAGILGGMLKIKIAAPAEKGKANKAVIDFLSEKIGVKKNNIAIISGQSSPVKQIRISGISANELLSKLDLNE